MDVRDELLGWLSRQDPWQRDLARRLAGRTGLSGADYDEALAMVKGAFGALEPGQAAPEPKPLESEHLPTGAGASPVARIVSFGNLVGVGAVASDYALRFDPQGLTIVYGQNAAGKSTYVRALKRVCRTVDRDAEVLGNVFDSDGPSSGKTATIELDRGGKKRGQKLDLADAGPPELANVSIFDARAAELYVDERNDVAYVPAAARLLARLATAQGDIRADLELEAAEAEAQAPTFGELLDGTEAARVVAGLTGKSDIGEVKAFARLGRDERARLAELRAIVAAAAAKTARADAQAARADQGQATSLAAQLRDLAARVAAPATAELRRAAAEVKARREAVELAARELGDQPLSDVGGEPWRELWRAAGEFAQSVEVAFPPPAGERCPLCMQEMTDEAADRLAHFNQHVRSSVQERAAKAAAELSRKLERLGDEHVAACRTGFLAALEQREPELHGELDRFLETVGGRMAGLRSDSAGAEAVPVAVDPVDRLDRWAKARGKRADDLEAADDPKREQALRGELAELDAREKLSLRLGDAEKSIAALARAGSLRSAHRALATNRLTREQKRLTEEAVTTGLGGALRRELEALDCAVPVGLDPRTRAGETDVALRLAGVDGTSVSEIASEGERRALALAFFLAEVAVGDHDGGIVVDDPVSSLDDERRAHIAERLVAEAQRRQVIVFTHDLPFMLDLHQQATDAGVDPLIQHVWTSGAEVGRVDDHAPFKAMKLKDRLKALRNEVQNWDNQSKARDYDEEWRRVCDFYAKLRGAWERGVEERLLRGVVQRFQREVKTKTLKSVVVTDDLVSLIDDGMTQCSKYLHDEPAPASVRLPDRAALAKDVEKLKEFMDLTK